MAIQIECPICGSMEWVLVGWTNPLLVWMFECAVCGYKEKYVEPKDRNVCPCCDVERSPKIGKKEPRWNIRFQNECPECKSRIYLSWDKKKEVLQVRCSKCKWKVLK